MVSVAIFASGNGSNFEELVKAKSKYYNVELLIVDQKNAFALERGKNLGVISIFLDPKKFNSKAKYEENILSILKEYSVEYIVLAGYMRIISSVLLKNFENKIINIHPSYLPEFMGKYAIEDAFNAKVSQTGVTVHYVDEGIDSGEIIYQERIGIEPSWNKEVLADKIHEREHKVYSKILNELFERRVQI